MPSLQGRANPMSLFGKAKPLDLVAQIEADCAWLRSLSIMDYSLLVLLHFPGRADPDGADDVPPFLQDTLEPSLQVTLTLTLT